MEMDLREMDAYERREAQGGDPEMGE